MNNTQRINNRKAYIKALSFNEQSPFKDGGLIDEYSDSAITKVYVSIRVKHNTLRNPIKTIYHTEYEYEDKVFKELSNFKLNGVIGVSTNKWNVSNWFVHRDCLIVMDFKKFKELNNATQVLYNDPDYLMANDMEVLLRLSDRKNDDIQSKIDIIHNFSKHLVPEFSLVKADSPSLNKEWANLEYAIDPHKSHSFTNYIRRINPTINSPKDFANLMLDYVKDPEEKNNLMFPTDLTNQLTVDDIVPIIELGVKRQGNVFQDEGEWILEDKTLNIPKDSQLFFKADFDYDSETLPYYYDIEKKINEIRSNKGIVLKEKITEYNLYDKYKVYFVKHAHVERYARQQFKVKENIFNERLEERKKALDQKKLDTFEIIKDVIVDDFSKYIESILEKKDDGSLETYRHIDTEWEDDNPYPHKFTELPLYQELFDEIDICIRTIVNEQAQKPITEITGWNISEVIKDDIKRCLELQTRKLESILEQQNNYQTSSGYESNNQWWDIIRFFSAYSYEEGLYNGEKYKSIYKNEINDETHRLYDKKDIWKFKEGGKAPDIRFQYGGQNNAQSIEEIHKDKRGEYLYVDNGIVIQNLFHGTCKYFRKFDTTKKGSATADDLMSLLGFSFSPSVEKVFEHFAGYERYSQEQEQYAVDVCGKEFTEEQREENEDEWFDCISEVKHNAPTDCRAITVSLTGKKILTTSETDLNKYGLRLLEKSGELKKLEKQAKDKVINKYGTRYKDIMFLPNGYYELKKNNWELSNQKAINNYYAKTWKELRVAMAKAIWKDLLAQGYDIIRYENEVEVDTNEPFDYIPYSTKQIKPLERIYDGEFMDFEILDYKKGGQPTNFWGNSGSGVLLKANDTGRYLILKRSEWVNEPNTWGIISGKTDGDETPIQTAQRELAEETGLLIEKKDLEPNYIFKDGDFKFYNFLGTVESEFEPTLDWENSDYVWADLDKLPTPVHFGLQELIANKFKKGGLTETLKNHIIFDDVELGYHQKNNLMHHSLFPKLINTDLPKGSPFIDIDYKDDDEQLQILYTGFVKDVKKKATIKNGKIRLWRSLALDSIKSLDRQLGVYWGIKPTFAVTYDDGYYEKKYTPNYDNPTIIQAEFNLSDIDWQNSFELFLMNDWMEGEIRVKAGAKAHNLQYKNIEDKTWKSLDAKGKFKAEEGGAYEGWQDTRESVTEMPVVGEVAKPFHNLAKGIDKTTGGKSEMFTDPIGGVLGKLNDGGVVSTEYQFRDIDGSVAYYKRENGGKWHFISRKEFLQDARRDNIVLEKTKEWQDEYRKLESDMFKLSLNGVGANDIEYHKLIKRRAELEYPHNNRKNFSKDSKELEDGGIVEGQLHSECNDETGCGEKFDVGNSGHIIEVERDEAVIVSSAFNNNNQYEIEGTPSQIASALNTIGGGKDFDSGASVNGEVLKGTKKTSDTDVDEIDGNSIIINRRSMYDNTKYKAKGTTKQIASLINNIDDNGVKITSGGTIEKA